MNTEQKRIQTLLDNAKKKVWTDLDYYEHYKLTRRIGFSSISFKPLDDRDFDWLKSELIKHKDSFYRIYKIATNDDKERLRNSFIVSLNKLLACQDEIELNIKALITTTINEIKLPNSLNNHPTYDPNLFNNKGYELFKYLFDNFYKGKIRELTNIWFFLKECNRSKYVLYATKDVYKEFILKNYKIEIKNFDKSCYNYDEKVKPKLGEHLINYENSLK